MQSVSPNINKNLHSKLPIDADETILAVYKHHWFAYASSWLVGIFLVLIIMGLAVGLTMGSDPTSSAVQYRSQIIVGAGIFSFLLLLGTSIPVYLKSQEQIVLTEEALLQVLQPSLFASKIDQLSLQHITDVTVRQDFFGTILGYGYITIETPGEQNNYRFSQLPNPHAAAREIIAAHENFDAALQGGRMPSTLGSQSQAPPIDPQQYQQFLQYQQMMQQQQQDQAAQQNGSADDQQSEDPTRQ